MPITHTPPSNPWFRIQPAAWPVRLRLFCFHHAGGAASAYRLWQAHLPANIQVCAVQPPGRATRICEQPFTEMNGLVDACLLHMKPYLDQPFALFGHSMGSLVAYEVAQRFYRQAGRLPTYLFVSGRRAPQLPDPHPHLHRLADNDLLAAIHHRYGGVPDIVFQDAEMKALFTPLLRADFTLVETYQPSTLSPLPCPLIALGGAQDAHATEPALTAWQALTRSEFALHCLPGGHFYLNEQRLPLLALIASYLARADA